MKVLQIIRTNEKREFILFIIFETDFQIVSAGTQDQLNCQQSLGFALNVFYQIVNLLTPGKTGWYSLYMFYDVIWYWEQTQSKTPILDAIIIVDNQIRFP